MKLLNSLILVYVFIYLIAHGQENIINITNNNKIYTIKTSELKESLKYQEIPRTASCNLKQADDLISGKMVFLKRFPAVPYNTNILSWKENPYQNRSWQLSYENLRHVSILNACYEKTHNDQYHTTAKDIVLSYIKTHPSFDVETSEFSWSDHAIAYRTLHILETLSHELEQKDNNSTFIQKSFDHLGLNTEFMMDDKNHYIHNHSLMMDRSLIALSKVYKPQKELSSALKQKGLSRSVILFNQMIDETGLVKEHSIGYQILNHNFFKDVFQLLDYSEIDKETMSSFNKMPEILEMLVKPDLSFPIWGDSKKINLTKNIVKNFDNNPRLKAILDSSLELNSTVSFINNIGVIRDKKNDFYLAFFANYYSKVHKHHDDLSFVLQFDKVDIFTDAGMYGYEKKYRPLLMSSLFHNTISINGKDYKINKKGQYAKIVDYKKSQQYEMIKGEHNFYDDKIVERTIYYIKPNAIVLIDKVKGKGIKTIQQVFNLGENANLLKNQDRQIKFKFNDTLSVVIQQYKEADQKIYYGNKDRGFVSQKYSEITPIYQLEFNTNIKEFLTSIIISSNKAVNPITEIKIQNSKIIYKINNTWHSLDT